MKAGEEAASGHLKARAAGGGGGGLEADVCLCAAFMLAAALLSSTLPTHFCASPIVGAFSSSVDKAESGVV